MSYQKPEIKKVEADVEVRNMADDMAVTAFAVFTLSADS